jgi:hypothetical protein
MLRSRLFRTPSDDVYIYKTKKDGKYMCCRYNIRPEETGTKVQWTRQENREKKTLTQIYFTNNS